MIRNIKESVKQGAWEYLTEMATDERTELCNKLFIPVPQKLLRCLNLSHQAKIILLDIMSYMGRNNNSYPPIEDIALNCGMSHATVQKFIKELEEKNILKVYRRQNNMYYLVNELKLSGYVMLSELLHEFRRRMKSSQYVSEKQRNKFIKKMLRISEYKTALEELEKVRAVYSENSKAGDIYVRDYCNALRNYAKVVDESLKKEYPMLYAPIDLKGIAEIKLNETHYPDGVYPFFKQKTLCEKD